MDDRNYPPPRTPPPRSRANTDPWNVSPNSNSSDESNPFEQNGVVYVPGSERLPGFITPSENQMRAVAMRNSHRPAFNPDTVWRTIPNQLVGDSANTITGFRGREPYHASAQPPAAHRSSSAGANMPQIIATTQALPSAAVAPQYPPIYVPVPMPRGRPQAQDGADNGATWSVTMPGYSHFGPRFNQQMTQYFNHLLRQQWLSRSNDGDVFAMDHEIFANDDSRRGQHLGPHTAASNSRPGQQVVQPGNVAYQMNRNATHHGNFRSDLANGRTQPPVWEQETVSESFKRHFGGSEVGYEVAYPGALAALTSLNPEVFQMPWNSRVISIKTDYPLNLIWAVRNGAWVFPKKVTERLTHIWRERRDRKEQILFLFSVNNSRRYCGLAEMRGLWFRGGNLSGWHTSNNNEELGTVPIVWYYVKNVPYSEFSSLRHANNQPIVNMWNGMPFPSDIGRAVIARYVKAPHITNMLCRAINSSPRSGSEVPNGINPTLMLRAALNRSPISRGQWRSSGKTRRATASSSGEESVTPLRYGVRQNGAQRPDDAVAGMYRNFWHTGSAAPGASIDEPSQGFSRSNPIPFPHLSARPSVQPTGPFDASSGYPTADSATGLRPGNTITFIIQQDGTCLPAEQPVQQSVTAGSTQIPQLLQHNSSHHRGIRSD